jgi:beta-glucosidase
VTVSVDVENAGSRDGEEVVQLYVTDLQASVPEPLRQLQGFRRIALKAGQKQTVTFEITPYQLSLIDAANRRVVEPGEFRVSVGGGQPGVKGRAANATPSISGILTVTGNAVEMK